MQGTVEKPSFGVLKQEKGEQEHLRQTETCDRKTMTQPGLTGEQGLYT